MDDINDQKINYDPKAQVPFADPVVKCDSCSALIRREAVRDIGSCTKCGNRRIRNCLVLTTEDMAQCKEWGIDPDFLALFESVDEAAATKTAPKGDNGE